MGSATSSATIDPSQYYVCDRIFTTMNDSRLLRISISTETDEKCNMVESMVGLQYGTSLISKPQKVTAITGYSWPLNQVLSPQDAVKTVSMLAPYSPDQQTLVNDICRHPGLSSDYSEQYPRPRTLPENSVYVRLLFEVVRSGGKKGSNATAAVTEVLAITRLSGCVNKEDLDFTLEETSTVLQQLASSDPYVEYTRAVLPGDKFRPVRHAFSKWWGRVVRQLQHSRHREKISSLRETFFQLTAKQSRSYRSFLESGRERYKQESNHCQHQSLQTGYEMVDTYIHSVCDAAENLIEAYFDPSSQKHCLEKISAIRNSFLKRFHSDLSALMREMACREEAAWEQYKQEAERLAAMRSKIVHQKNQQEPTSPGMEKLQTKSSSRYQSRSGSMTSEDGGGGGSPVVSKSKSRSGRKQSVKGAGRPPSPSSPLAPTGPPRRMSLVSTNKASTHVSVLSLRANQLRVDVNTDGESVRSEDLSTCSPTHSNRSGGSPTRRQSVAPLTSLLQAWSAPVDVSPPQHLSPSTGIQSKQEAATLFSTFMSTSAARRGSVMTSDPMVPSMISCEQKSRMVNALCNAKTKDMCQLEENLLHGCVLDLKLCMYEMAMVEQMESYMVRELAGLTERLEKIRDKRLNDLRIMHLKDKGASMVEQWDQIRVEKMIDQQTAQTVKLQGKLDEHARYRKAKFQESKRKTFDIMMTKLSSLHRRLKNSPLSDTGLEKLKSVCIIYQTLREGY